MRFAAVRAPWYKGYLAGGTLTMTGDHMEHAITYWVMWQLFESPLLAGFAVISHWVPHLLFSIPFGALADRFDNRRIIQLSGGLFMLASLSWGVLILTDSLEAWHCVVLLLVHGFASALWHPADGMLVYDIVGPEDIASGVRLMATGLNLGQLVGPALGAALLFTVGPGIGMLLNIAVFLPFLIYLAVLPLDGHGRRAGARERVRLRDVFAVVGELPAHPSVLVVMVSQAAIGLFIGVALLPLLPEFGALLGQAESGLGYGLLLVAMATGAVLGGLGLEALGARRASTRLAVGAAASFALAILVFAVSHEFALSVAALLVAGVSNIVATSTAQTVVQLEAPTDRRGRYLGAFGVTNLGFRAGSGLLVGVIAGLVGVPAAVALNAGVLLVVALVLLAVVSIARARRRVGFDPATTLPLD